MGKDYPKQASIVAVTYIDGEVVSYRLTASHKIARYLMQEAGATGVLVIRDDDAGVSTCIPIQQIRSIEFALVNEN